MRADDDLTGLRLACPVHRPGDAGYQRARKLFLGVRDEVLPRAVIACDTEADVAKALAYARDHGVPFALRGGGHSPVEHSTSDGLVIDLSGLDSVDLGDGAVTVGAGVRVGELADRLADDGLLVPVGWCRSVGVVGAVLGGGYGVYGRYYGLGVDHLVSARVLLADGRVVVASADAEPELFWALRGAGGGAFGAVLSVRLRTRPAVPATAVRVNWDHEYAAAVIDAWQHIAPTAAPEVNLELSVRAAEDADEPPEVTAFGVVVGTPSDAEAVLSGFTARAGVPVLPAFAELPAAAAARHCDRPGDPDGHGLPSLPAGQRPGLRIAKAEFFTAPLPAIAGVALADHIACGRDPGVARELEFVPWGGALARGRDCAFRHRDPAFLVKHGVRTRAAARDAAQAWVAASWGITHPHGTGRAYQNLPDPDLPATAYFGADGPRLQDVKRQYDPRGLFRPPLWSPSWTPPTPSGGG